MSLVVVESVSLAFGKKELIAGLDLRIAAGDRVGLIGPNGSGKSSLMRLLAGEMRPDAGAVRTRKQLRVGYLPQDLDVAGGRTLLASVLAAVPGRAELDAECKRAEAEFAAAEAEADEPRILAAAEWLGEVHGRVATFEQDYSEHEARRILAGLGFSTRDEGRDLGEFSGGWKMRGALAGLLFQRPELLLLDEPTNHLDLPTVAWFGEFLRAYPHGFVLICHDREFLDEQIERVVSLEPEGVRQYRGDYEAYLRQRAEEEVVLANQAKNLAREREKAEQFIERFRAQANKARAVQSRVKQLAKMDEVQTLQQRETLRFRFPPAERSGGEPIRTLGLRKAYGEHVVLRDVAVRVARGDRIAILGVNGAGKTTLLKLLAGELRADGGEITLGHKTKLGYYAQHHADTLDPRRTVLETVAQGGELSNTRVRTLLGAFLFHDEDVDKPIGVLSGGERARVALARLLVDPGNVLLMDEPTNHLDLASSEALADALATFDGTIIFVSHNRSFVRRLATRIWNVEGGGVEVYPGTLDEYLDRHRGKPTEGRAAKPTSQAATPAAAVASAPARPVAAAATPRPAGTDRARRRAEAEGRNERARLLGPLRTRVRELEAEIERLEKAQRERNLDLARPETYADAPRRNALLTEYQRDADAIASATEAWELAQAELEALQASLTS
ncbi:MAG: ABC-F family ATP-binding cassette domain-containing protein [Nannocystaceae bacterium]|nr:ABC-F family ATP-binding cassette domain-containing protein [Nannocystaceae bacterium]